MPYRVVIIGAGFGGIGMAMALKKAGIDDFAVLERAGELGGTWRDNSYPGLTCDIPSQLYSFSFRPWRWSRRFPARDETLAYLHALVAERGLGPHLRFGSGVAVGRVRRAPGALGPHPRRWRHAAGDRGRLRASASSAAPSFPTSPAGTTSRGPSWHSARWNHDVDLAGKRVAVIGTGASAIQFVPEIAKTAAHVDVYQRSAPYVLPKGDRPYRHAEQAVFDRLPVVRKADRLRIFLYGELLTSGFVLSPKLLAAPMRLWRRQLDEQIADPRLREKCVPDYVMGCKRVLFSNDWYPALARPDVELVTDPIERIVPDGVVTADGTTRAADVIIYGTGFKTADFLAPMSVTGLGGQTLHQTWRDGAEAYFGITVSRVPELLHALRAQHQPRRQFDHLHARRPDRLRARRHRGSRAERLDWLDVRPEVQKAFNAWVHSASRTSVWESGCHSWYTTASGRNTNNWPDMTFRYRQRVRHFDLSGYRVMPKRPAAAVSAGAA